MTGGGELAILIIVVKCPYQILTNPQLSLKSEEVSELQGEGVL